MTAITLTEWSRRVDAGETTFAVGPVPVPDAVYLDRDEAEAAADESSGTYIEWHGRRGRQVTTAELRAYADAEGS